MGLEVQSVTKCYENASILEEISFNIKRGEFLTLLGPSGCGKTTLLRIIARLERDHGGSVRLDDQPIDQPSKRCSFVFQDGRLLPWLTALDNVAFAAGKDCARNAGLEFCQTMLRLVGLHESAWGLWPSQMSGGMNKRVALARALAGEPDVLLLDEPFSALDSQSKWDLYDLIRSLRKKNISNAANISLSRTAILLVSHDVTEAAYLSDRVILLSGTRPSRIKETLTIDMPQRVTTSDQFEDVCRMLLTKLLRSEVKT